ncbi:hypothetical protein BpOF4_19994 (plasmid) [Alkalihalophilus pseudofirmus OF4]|uniref:Uncharacterized protein n=1 Tax=Alkalihalophilus pseudofirmus (strain ATCC BAA-2126 / JCM 17055 / OF4) TaxID=398511 RepID=D3G0X2_ALKPO|nr:hypothetical protein [Alkalihalophilus pseudofirmus]ADC51998.1 hypothetical protein BpOF4_19994 [Alkalihalophilus pseudofirmus OF4]
MRAALFQAALSEDFNRIIHEHLKEGKELPRPRWGESDDSVWLEAPAKQKVITEEKQPFLISQSKKNGKISIVIT